MNQRYCNGMTHVIKKGDNLYQLSRMYRVPLALILRANPYVDVYNLQPGQEICIPVARRYPGMRMAPGMQPEENREERTQERENERREMEEREMGMPESVTEMPDVMERIMPEAEEQEEQEGTYISDGTKSLGDLLNEFGMSLSEFVEKNDISQVVIAADVVLYLPKKV